jgi:hypothetical protein
MKRDLELVRAILFALEPLSVDFDHPATLSLGHPSPLVLDGYTPEQVAYHLRIMGQGDLVIRGAFSNSTPDSFQFFGLTWAGHEFLDEVRDPDTWSKVKKGASKVGGIGFGLAIELAKAYAKQKLGL